MPTPVLNFLQRFHNFNGITIGQRKKELFLLLRENEGQIQTAEDINYLIQHLKPRTYLEQKMIVLVLLHFHQEKELLVLFTGGNEKLIKLLWKQTWFFENLLKNAPVESIVNEIFPNLSYVSRIRFLKNVIYYMSNEEQFDKLYDSVFKKYGQSNAQYLFPGCSLDKKLNILKSGLSIKLSNQHIIFLHKNKVKHLEQLLKLRNDCKIFDFYDTHSKAFKFIAGSNCNIFTDIFKANECSSIGKRLTRKLMKTEMPYVIEKASDIQEKLHRRSLLKGLKSNFEKFYLATWPSSLKHFHRYSSYRLLKFYRRTEYVEIIQKGLREKYNTSLSENPDLIDEVLLENTKNIEIRESLLELKMRESKDEYTLPLYYGIDKSIPILKKKINFADGVRTRENLISALVKTCKINDDVNALLKVQEYFYFRHKNDDATIRQTFLSEMKDSFDLSNLCEEHWKLILPLLKWCIIKDKSFWWAGEFYMLHIKYLYKNNATEEMIDNLLFNEEYMTSILRSFTNSWSLINDVPKLQKFFLQHFVKPLPLSSYETDQKTDLHFEFFKAILVWNQNNPNDNINYCLCADIKESIKSTLEKQGRSYSCSSNKNYLFNFIKGKIPCEDKQFLQEIEQIYWNKLSDNFSANIMEYYLRNNPQKIVENFDPFIASIKSEYLCDALTIWRLLKHYDHLGLAKKVIEYFTKNGLDLFGNIGMGLAILIEPEEFKKLMEENKTEMLDMNDKEQVQKYNQGRKLLGVVKYNDSPTILPYIVQYCQGDSLHDALTPLYYYFYHSPESSLLEHLQVLSDRAVSVRKHAVKLACSVSPVHVVYTLARRMTETEKNQSALEHMYWKTFKYFLANSSEEFWSLLQLQLQSLDISESNAFKESCDLKKIPKSFRQSYLDFIWKLLDEKEKLGVNVSDFKDSLIRSLSPEMFKELSYEFCSVFIQEKLLKFGNKNQNTIQSFVFNCLKYSAQKELLLKDVFCVVNEFKKNYVLHREFKISCSSRNDLNRFVSDFFYSHRDFDFGIIEAFYNHWIKLFTATEDIQNFIKLKLLIELNGMKDFDLYIAKISEIFMELLADFGILGVIECFKDAVCILLPNEVFHTEDSEEKIYKLALKLTEFEKSQLNLLAITILPQQIPENQCCIEIQRKLIEILKKTNDKSVLINLDLYISSLY